MDKSYDSIDIAKFIASIMIITMHLGAFSDYGRVGLIQELLSRWCVPFFFIASSFFLFSKIQAGGVNIIYKFTSRIIKLYLVWLIINLPSIVYSRLYTKDLSQIDTWLTFIKNSILSSTFTGSWYLVASIWGAWFDFFLSKRFSTYIVMLMCFAIYCLSCFSSAYYGVMPHMMAEVLVFLCFPLNIFGGCFYFSLGKLIVENKTLLIRKITIGIALSASIAFYLIYFAEIFITKKWGILDKTDYAFSVFGIAFFLFMLCLKVNICINNAMLLRKLSTIIYCCQGNVLCANLLFRKVTGSSLISWLVSLLVVAVICVSVLYIQNKRRWSWSKYLT